MHDFHNVIKVDHIRSAQRRQINSIHGLESIKVSSISNKKPLAINGVAERELIILRYFFRRDFLHLGSQLQAL